ncbi:hypothetical protein FDP41_013708 [Naegleria fowleri]|uniref:Uncharacterized protein n=1 Tax=Naegleria fowleri TaxID=5763 RepID=A0A6A5C1S1_NAEFO|nr:uncharacterized protein FDP41_013708 [Naegleria fowleri]KAF0980494.1 hypothetical protein FDP41_013708 [Naegleria fowleri]
MPHYSPSFLYENPTLPFSLLFPLREDMSTSLLQDNTTSPPIPSVTNTSQWTDSVKYSLSVVLTSGPFFLIFWTLLVVSIVVYALKRREMKRNQHILFILTIILASHVTANLTFRMISELGNFASIGINKPFNLYYSIIGIIQRVIINYWVWHQLLMMAFLCNVFVTTCRETGVISQNEFKRMRMILVSTLIGASIFFVMIIIAVVVMGALVSAEIIHDATSVLTQQVSIYLVATVVFLVFTLTFSIMLNVTGYKLNISLQESVKKLKAKRKQDLWGLSPPESSSSSQNETRSSSVHSKSQSGGAVSFLIVGTNKREREHTLELKQMALRKTRIVQAGLSIALISQIIGFIFIPLIVAWQFNTLFFHAFTNVGLAVFISLMITINTPMQEVQRMFRRNSQISVESNDGNGRHAGESSKSAVMKTCSTPSSSVTMMIGKDMNEDNDKTNDPAQSQTHHHLSTSTFSTKNTLSSGSMSHHEMKDVQSPSSTEMMDVSLDSEIVSSSSTTLHQV